MVTPNSIGQDMARAVGQYSVVWNEKTKVWRIYDLKHPAMQGVRSFDDDIPDDSPAVVVLSEGAFNRLIAEAVKLGIINSSGLDEAFDDTHWKEEIAKKDANFESLKKDWDELIAELNGKDKLIERQQERLDKLGEDALGSEKYRLKKKSIDAIIRLAGMQDVAEGS